MKTQPFVNETGSPITGMLTPRYFSTNSSTFSCPKIALYTAAVARSKAGDSPDQKLFIFLNLFFGVTLPKKQKSTLLSKTDKISA